MDLAEQTNEMQEKFHKLRDKIVEVRPLHEIVMAYVEYSLARHKNNKVHTAKALEVDRRSLQRWAKKGVVGRFLRTAARENASVATEVTA